MNTDYSTFSTGDILDLPSLASKLKQPSRPVDSWLAGELDSGTKTALSGYLGLGSDPTVLQAGFVHDFSRLIQGPLIFESQRFVGFKLRERTQRLLSQNPQGNDLLRLNRMLFEDAYSQELSRRMNAFLCHSSEDARLVLQVASHLRRHFVKVFAFEDSQHSDSHYLEQIHEAERESDVMVVFVGASFTDWQKDEVLFMVDLEKQSGQGRHYVFVAVNGQQNVEDLGVKAANLVRGRLFLNDEFSTEKPPAVVKCSRKIIERLNIAGLVWKGADQLPYNPHLFDYEKRIIDFFREMKGADLSSTTATSTEREKIEKVRRMLRDGCPDHWPKVKRWLAPKMNPNLLPEPLRGDFRPDSSMIVAAALTQLGASDHGLVLPEAGPREKLYYPRPQPRQLNVGILVLGGIAPGINTVIDAIVQRHWLYQQHHDYPLNIYGFQNGLWALEDVFMRTRLLRPDSTYHLPAIAQNLRTLETSEHATEGGSMLGTWRANDLTNVEKRQGSLKNVVEKLRALCIDIVYVIGGDGSMKAAHALWNVAQSLRRDGESHLSVVAIPKTMDNDILWMWQSFGFSSAVQKAREIVQELHTEVKSNPRLCVLQLYGSDSGFVVSHTVIASATDHCDLALIPEEPFSMIGIAHHLKKKMWTARRSIPHGLVVMAETAIPTDALECLGERELAVSHPVCKEVAALLGGNEPIERVRDRLQQVYNELKDVLQNGLTEPEKKAIRDFDELRKNGQRIQGQTEDMLRQASLHLVLAALPFLLPRQDVGTLGQHHASDWSRLRLVANEPRHLLRATPPSTSDITMAQRLGILAVDNALAGYTDFMISQWLTEFVLVPLGLVVLGRKRIPQNGIFWKSVLAKTGQYSAETVSQPNT